MTQLVRFLTEPVDGALLQLPRALSASVLAMCLDVGLLLLLVETGALPAALALVLSYLAGCVVQYVLCTHWVFPASCELPNRFAIFMLLSTVGLLITWFVMQMLHQQLHVPYLSAKVASLGLAFAWNFLSRKYLMFRAERASHAGTLPRGGEIMDTFSRSPTASANATHADVQHRCVTPCPRSPEANGQTCAKNHIFLPNTAATLRQSAISFTNVAGVSD